MATEAATQEILAGINEIKVELKNIKEHMVDVDEILTEDDFAALQEYRKEKEEGYLVSHEELLKEIGE